MTQTHEPFWKKFTDKLNEMEKDFTKYVTSKTAGSVDAKMKDKVKPIDDWQKEKSLEINNKTKELLTPKEVLGRGAYGQVYLAELKSSGFKVAAKLVHDDDQAKDTIKKEVDILKRCNSPFIVNYFGCVIPIPAPAQSPPADGKKDTKKDAKGKKTTSNNNSEISMGANGVWILMDYCGGGSIRDYMDATSKVLNEYETSCVLIGVIQGIAYLHSQRIIHRDLKAANILLTEDGQVKIADFGISTQLSATITGNAKTMIGTTYWMAPEVVAESYTHKIDMWSMAITGIEMAENHPPWWDMKPFQVILKLPKENPPTLRSPSSFSKEFNSFLDVCLKKDPQQRPNADLLLQSPFILNALGQGTQTRTDTLARLARDRKAAKRN